MLFKPHSFILVFFIFFLNCSNNSNTDTETINKHFKMGFTTWSYGPNQQDVNNTYNFIKNNADIYTEHIDSKIPWNSWIHNLDLPAEFTNEITGRVNKKINNKPLLLSVSIFNSNRDELAEDFNGTAPSYSNLENLKDAYFKHINYLVDKFNPNYLVIAIEVNEFRLRAENKWSSYKTLIKHVKSKIKQAYPSLKVSESISLHNLYKPDIPNPTTYINEIISYMNQMDFVAISFYPFLKNLHTTTEFQEAFNFLHKHINKPIAFVESAHIAEDLIIPNLNVFIKGNAIEQNNYLETLLANAQEQNYEFVIWWAHRDYDALWETFPEALKDVGKIWRDTGLLDENGNERLAIQTWKTNLSK